MPTKSKSELTDLCERRFLGSKPGDGTVEIRCETPATTGRQYASGYHEVQVHISDGREWINFRRTVDTKRAAAAEIARLRVLAYTINKAIAWLQRAGAEMPSREKD